jgi:hypothetical protein
MLYLFVGFASAALFGIGIASLYGTEAVIDNPWVDYTFWALILTGAAFAALENAAGLWCRVCNRLAGAVAICARPRCGQAA